MEYIFLYGCRSVSRYSFVSSCRNLIGGSCSFNLSRSTWRNLPCTSVDATTWRLISTSEWNKMKIYTKTGDKGTTALYTGERRVKNDPFFEALGATDELSSHIALCREFAIDGTHGYEERLHRIQCILQDIGSLVATPKSSAREAHLKNVQFSSKHVLELEEWIDEYTEKLPPLQNFILPGGGKASASIHIARTVCRRAERAITPLVAEGEVDKQALIYMNRLSDFLFTLARYAAKLDTREETIYIKEKNCDQ